MESTQTSAETSEPDNKVTNQDGDVDMARIEAMLTPEQVLSDTVARKRRKFTKKHNPSFSRREATPLRNLDGKVTSSDEDDVPEQRPKTPERRRTRRSRSFGKQNCSEPESELSRSTLNHDSRSSSCRQTPTSRDERKKSLSNLAHEEVKSFLDKTKKSLTAAAARSRERFRKQEKRQVKRSQSAPHEFTEAELIESFRRAQLLSAEDEKRRKFSDTSLQSLAAEEAIVPKPLRPEAQSVIRQRKRQREYSEKIVEILDPNNSEFVRKAPQAKPAAIEPLDLIRVLRFVSLFELYKSYRLFLAVNRAEYTKLKRLWNKCMLELFLIMVFCGIGGFIFKFTEGSFENFYKCGVKRVKRDFIDALWIKSHSLREEEWKSLARSKLRTFEEELHAAHEAGMTSYSGQRSWSFLNGVVYALTIVTTIGYGHLYPTTTTGRALTIVYSIIGIPLFLIALTDFGKLFTRGIKFLWSFVRRVYYTGSCRKVRKSGHVQEIFKGAQLMYDIATFRRSSNQDTVVANAQASTPGTAAQSAIISDDATPTTPAISNYEIDDEFNLPISVALFILISYIFCGALIYCVWERWDFFASFYFVFISMSTIGFGDYVPRHPICMIVSIVYLVFGLALMSMCINVVQLKLSETFQQASAKLGGSIGFEVDDTGSVVTVDNIGNVESVAVEMGSEAPIPVHQDTPNDISRSEEPSGTGAKLDVNASNDSSPKE